MAEVLIVDDDLDTSELIVDALEMEGHHVRCACGGDAVAAAPEMRPDVILLDLHMAGMDGAAVGRRLREDPRTSGIPIVVMSGDPDAVRREAPAVAADGQLIKPFDLYELYRQVDRLSP